VHSASCDSGAKYSLEYGEGEGRKEMSLEGLDHVKVKEVYDTAVAEPGGWYVEGEAIESAVTDL
jgi:hypothetical protein